MELITTSSPWVPYLTIGCIISASILLNVVLYLNVERIEKLLSKIKEPSDID